MGEEVTATVSTYLRYGDGVKPRMATMVTINKEPYYLPTKMGREAALSAAQQLAAAVSPQG